MPAFPDVTLSGPRVTLRALRPDDAPAILEAGQDAVTQRWLPLPIPYTEDHARGWCGEASAAARESGRGLVRAICVGDRAVGSIDLKRTEWVARVTEIGYLVAPSSRGNGFAAEAVRVLSGWVLLDQDFERVELRIAPENVASLAVAARAGFVREGVARNAGYVHGGRVDLEIWSLVPSDLLASEHLA